MTETETRSLEVPRGTVQYDVRGDLDAGGPHRVLVLAGYPMDATGFGTLASYFTDRPVVTYDPRPVGRSSGAPDDRPLAPEDHAGDLHRLIDALGVGPVDLFGSSGGAVNGLRLVADHPEDVRVFVAHEPPLLASLPDADAAFAAERGVQTAYHERGFGAGMAQFIALTSWTGEFNDEYAAQPPADPAMFGMPTDDDGNRDDPLLSGTANAITAYEPDIEALRAAPTRVVIGVGVESRGTITGRTSVATAESLGQEAVEFPSHHGGFLGGEFGYAGQPEAFAVTLREVLDKEAS